ncbi:hypothetical protein [Pseudogulbenkiania subflava]|uniref:Uncharacterized protein n=1 Tax=Pseudogulbenkiania subflava DSM 22618 TaxID=1123014 RepID=A0A1Y6BJF9_9NEIS|nr:hypothetical protein [Pseudogulbenkiania subflava]SMF04070.1 hypothetical protein SAMN02745746_00925 [Pseudogulbenkiania subflava DSM 22618]
MASTPATTTPDETENPRKKTPPLMRNAFKLRETANNSWRAVADRGVTRERLLDSDYWSVVSQDMLPFDTISVIAADRSFYAELLITDCGRGYCHVEELLFKPLMPLLVINDKLPPGFSISYDGPDSQWTVHRLCDGVIMGTNFPNRDAALTHLLDHATLRG